MTQIKEVDIDLTQDQCIYLASDPDASPGDIPGPPQPLSITMVSSDGWIFVEQTACKREDGSGVWVNPEGIELYG